jgi:hypothetical protein
LSGTTGFYELPKSVQAVGTRVSVSADTLQDGVLGAGSMKSVKDLNQSAAAIRGDLIKRQKLLEKLMKQNGTNIDIGKEVANFKNKLTGITTNALKIANLSAKDMRGMMSGGAGISGLNAIATKELGKEAATKLASKGGAGVVLGQGTGRAKTGQGDAGKSSESINTLTADENAALLAVEARAKKERESQEAQNKGNAVNEDNGYTLFDIITNRYQKSAYPRLFKKIQE